MIDLTQKDIRHEYMIQRLRMEIAYQVRLIRLQRGFTQKQLAEKCHTKQPAIAQVENWNAKFPGINTLRQIAKGLDCALLVRFETWEEIINSIVPDYEKDKEMAVDTGP